MAKELPSKWFNPRSMGNDCKCVPEKSGVYMIIGCDLDSMEKNYRGYRKEVLYVGCSKNLKMRYISHEVLNILRQVYEYVMFYFRETKDYKENEIKLIKLHKPRFNKQHND